MDLLLERRSVSPGEKKKGPFGCERTNPREGGGGGWAAVQKGFLNLPTGKCEKGSGGGGPWGRKQFGQVYLHPSKKVSDMGGGKGKGDLTAGKGGERKTLWIRGVPIDLWEESKRGAGPGGEENDIARLIGCLPKNLRFSFRSKGRGRDPSRKKEGVVVFLEKLAPKNRLSGGKVTFPWEDSP